MNIFRAQNRGFTLIEVLVTVAVVGIMMTLTSVIFINTVRSSKKSEITAEARENASLVIDRIQRDGRDATNYSNAVAGATFLTITKPDSSTITWTCHTPDLTGTPKKNGYISRQVGTGTDLSATNLDITDGISITNCLFKNINTTPPTMRFTFTTNAGVGITSAPQEYGVNLPFQVSISPR